MLLFNKQSLGEQALNKIAELALSSQFNGAQELQVQVKTDPSLLAQGRLAGLSMKGVGLQTQKNLRMQEMKLQMGNIAVSPFKALLGNIELMEPTHGTAGIVLTEGDFNGAFNNKSLKARLEGFGVTPLGLHVRFLSQGELKIEGEMRDRRTNHLHQVSIVARPQVNLHKGAVLTNVCYFQGEEFYPDITSILLEAVQDVLNLRNFQLEGLSLEIADLEIKGTHLILKATAKMTRFPSK